MHDIQDLATLIRAGTPLLVLESAEETRAVEHFRQVLAQVMRPLYRWSITDGLTRLDLDSDAPDETPPDASATLAAIKALPNASIVLLLDFHGQLRYAVTQRLMREIIERQRSEAHTLVLIAAQVELPPEIALYAVRIAPKLPDEAELTALLREEAFAYSRVNDGRRVTLDNRAAKLVVRNLIGLTARDARRILRHLLFTDGALSDQDLPALAKLKFELLNREGLLHFVYDTAQFADVAGLARLKRWVEQRRAVFVAENAPTGLDPPRGLLLLGVQGCGKSLAAKAVAGGFGVPLVRLDFGALYNKFHGETERNLRDSLRNAEALAPCVLWIDEIEKGVATSDADDGVSRRVLGYLLTWMAERKASVFMVATANAIDLLPAELLRKGRFDEIFFVDLPSADVRAEVLRIHCRRRKLDAASLDVEALATASAGFSGAELEQALVSAMYAAHADGVPLAHRHVLAEIGATKPLSVLMAEKVSALRTWAATRTVPAD